MYVVILQWQMHAIQCFIVFIGEVTQNHPITVATLPHSRSFGTFKKDFQLNDACGFVTNGLQVGIGMHTKCCEYCITYDYCILILTRY